MTLKRRESSIQGRVRSRILLSCIVIFIILGAVIAAFGKSPQTDASLTESDKAAIRDLGNLAAAAASILQVYMDGRVTEMLACSLVSDRLRDAITAPETRSDANRAFKSWLNSSGSYEAVLLVDKSGTCLAAAPETLVNRDFAGDEAFKGAIAGKLSVSDAHKSDIVASLSPTSKGWTLAIAVPIKRGDGPEGVLMSLLKWSKVTELLLGVRAGETGYALLLNQQGQVVAHRSEHFYGKTPRDAGAPMILDDAVKKKAPYISYEFNNLNTGKIDTKFTGFAYPRGYGNFPGLGWTVGAVCRPGRDSGRTIILGRNLPVLGAITEIPRTKVI